MPSITEISQHLHVLREIAGHKLNPNAYKTMAFREQEIHHQQQKMVEEHRKLPLKC